MKEGGSMYSAEKVAILKDLINGEWVDCDKVQEALSIDFSTGLKMFDFSRTAEWNPPPLNGQKITTKFRLKGLKEGRWKGAGMGDYYCSLCCTTFSGGDTFKYCPECGAKMGDDQ